MASLILNQGADSAPITLNNTNQLMVHQTNHHIAKTANSRISQKAKNLLFLFALSIFMLSTTSAVSLAPRLTHSPTVTFF
jgi:hypothetical protein